MNYRGMTIREFSDFAKNQNNYTFGELIFAIFRLSSKKHIREIISMTDEEVYKLITLAKKEELEEEIITK